MDINVNSICENYEEDLTELIENVKMKIAEKDYSYSTYSGLYVNGREKLIKFRDKEIKKLSDEIKKYNRVIAKIEKGLDSIKGNNECICTNHKYALISSEYHFGRKVGCYPLVRYYSTYWNIYKCVYCGKEQEESQIDFYQQYEYVRRLPKTPDECLTKSIAKKVFSDKMQEIYNNYLKLIEYVGYLNYLKERICEMFGHDVVGQSGCSFQKGICKHCGKKLGYNADGRAFAYNVKIDLNGYYHDEIIDLFLTPTERQKLSLPTFEMYQEFNKRTIENYEDSLIIDPKTRTRYLNQDDDCTRRSYYADGEYRRIRRPQTADEYKQAKKRAEEAAKKWY